MRKIMMTAVVLGMLLIGGLLPLIDVRAGNTVANSSLTGEGTGHTSAAPSPPETLGTVVWDGISVVYVNNTYASLQSVCTLIGNTARMEYWAANKTFMVHVNVRFGNSAITCDNSSIIFDTAAYNDLASPMWFGVAGTQIGCFNASYTYFNRCNGTGYYDNYGITNYYGFQSQAIHCYFARSGSWYTAGDYMGFRFSKNYFNVYDHIKGYTWGGTQTFDMVFYGNTWLYPVLVAGRIFNRPETGGNTNCIYRIENNHFYLVDTDYILYVGSDSGENAGKWYFNNNTVFNGRIGGLSTNTHVWMQIYGNTIYRTNISIAQNIAATNCYLYVGHNTFENCAQQNIVALYNTHWDYNTFQNSTSSAPVKLQFSNGTFNYNKFYNVNVSASSINIISMDNTKDQFYGSIAHNRAWMNRSQIYCFMPIFSLDAGKQLCHMYISDNYLVNATIAELPPTIQVYADALQPAGCCIKIENQTWYYGAFGNLLGLQLWNCSADYDWNQYGVLHTEAYNQNTSSAKPWPDSTGTTRDVNFSAPFNLRLCGVNKTAAAGVKVWINDTESGTVWFTGTTGADGYLYANNTHYINWAHRNTTMNFHDNYTIETNATYFNDFSGTFGWENTTWTYPDAFDALDDMPLNDTSQVQQNATLGLILPLVVSGSEVTCQLSSPSANARWGIDTGSEVGALIPNPLDYGNKLPIERQTSIGVDVFYYAATIYDNTGPGHTWAHPQTDYPYYAYESNSWKTSWFVFYADDYSTEWAATPTAANVTYKYEDGYVRPYDSAVTPTYYLNHSQAGVAFHWDFGLDVDSHYYTNDSIYHTPDIWTGDTMGWGNHLVTNSGISYNNLFQSFQVDAKPRAVTKNITTYAKAPVLGLNASDAYDPDNASNTLNYTWYFPSDGSVYYGYAINKTFGIPSVYRYVLIVADTNGAYDYRNGTITVLRNPTSPGNPVEPPIPTPPALTNDTLTAKLATFISRYFAYVVISALLVALGVVLWLFKVSRRLAWLPVAFGVLLLVLAVLGILPPLLLGG